MLFFRPVLPSLRKYVLFSRCAGGDRCDARRCARIGGAVRYAFRRGCGTAGFFSVCTLAVLVTFTVVGVVVVDVFCVATGGFVCVVFLILFNNGSSGLIIFSLVGVVTAVVVVVWLDTIGKVAFRGGGRLKITFRGDIFNKVLVAQVHSLFAGLCTIGRRRGTRMLLFILCVLRIANNFGGVIRGGWLSVESVVRVRNHWMASRCCSSARIAGKRKR